MSRKSVRTMLFSFSSGRYAAVAAMRPYSSCNLVYAQYWLTIRSLLFRLVLCGSTPGQAWHCFSSGQSPHAARPGPRSGALIGFVNDM